jgi:hypothetical protein
MYAHRIRPNAVAGSFSPAGDGLADRYSRAAALALQRLQIRRLPAGHLVVGVEDEALRAVLTELT